MRAALSLPYQEPPCQLSPHPGDRAPLPLTLNQLHDNVDGLLLRADPNETDDVGVVVLFQDPVEQSSDYACSVLIAFCTCPMPHLSRGASE